MNWGEGLLLITGHLLTVAGLLFAVVLFTRIRTENQHPGTTMAWLLGMVFAPYIAIPLYFLFGGRKIERLARKKKDMELGEQPWPHSAGDLRGPAYMILRSGDFSTVSSGNRVELLADGVKAYESLMHEIQAAEDSISIMTFILADDEVGRKVVRALARRAREGVKVRLLIDAIGSFWTRGAFTDPIRRAGGEVGVFMPVLSFQRKWSANLRNHRKICVFDGRKAIVGGRNIGDVYMGPEPSKEHWRDYGTVIEGPAVRNIAEVFAADWNFATGEPEEALLEDQGSGAPPPPAGNILLQPVASGPDVPNDAFYEQLLVAMFQARRRIWIVTPFFVPDRMISQTLRILAQCGLDIRLITPRRSTRVLVDFARRYFLRELAAAGGKVYLHGGPMVHGKVLLIDDDVVSVGSPNMDMRSLYLNYEIALFMYSREKAKEVETYMNGLEEESTLFDETKMSQGGAFVKTMENFCQLFAPLL